jgi:hypothetical protein
MQTIEKKRLFSAKAENELVNKIQNEIKEREYIAGHISRCPTDIPGDTLVFLAGELSLCASQNALPIYQQELWPLIRDCIPNPDDLISGTYDYARTRIRAICRLLNTRPEENAFKLAAALSPAREEKQGFPENILASGHKDYSEFLYSLFLMRLDAGFFLSGIETLWPQTAPCLIRTLYNQSGLAGWDQVLEENIPVLADYAPTLRRLFATTPARLDNAHFQTLLNLARTDNYPGLTLVDTGEDGAAVRPWHWYAADDFFKQFFPEKMESNDMEIVYDEASFSLKIVFSDSSWFQVLFSDESRERVDITDPELPGDTARFKGFYLFDTVSRKTGIEMDDDETLLIRFVGQIAKEAVDKLYATRVSGSMISIDKSLASPEFI